MTTSLQLAAFDTNGQGIDTEIILEFRNAKLSDALRTLQNKIDISLVYSPELIDSYDGVINLPLKKRSIKNTLELLLEGTDLTYRVNEGVLVIHVKPTQNLSTDKQSSLAQETNPFRVIGIVTDGVTQQPLPGVNVLVKGTTRGTTTDMEGKFNIDANDIDVLIFTFIGYKTFETQVNGRAVIDLAMEQDITALAEITINAGYYTTTEKTKTGNISKVTAKEIANQPVTNPLMALQGRVAGLDVTPINGTPGSAPTIRIRGTNSLRNFNSSDNGNLPLYVIDGLPIDSRPLTSVSSSFITNGFDPLSTLNPGNIESIEVLKDGDATAIYGSRGANGVILITTKQGPKSEKTNLDINFYQGFGEVTGKIDLLNTPQYLEMRREGFKNDNRAITTARAPDLLLWDTTRYTNWQEALLGRTARITNAESVLSWGGQKTSFRMGGAFHKETMVFPGDFYYQRASGNFSVNHISADNKLKIALSLNYGTNSNKIFDDANFVQHALSTPPNAPKAFNENGDLNWEIGPSGSETWLNPYSYLKKTNKAASSNWIASSNLSYELLPNFFLKTNLGFTELNGKESSQIPIGSLPPSYLAIDVAAQSNFGSNRRTSWIIEPQASYNKHLKNHQIDLLVGTSFQRNVSESQNIHATGYPSDVLLSSTKGATETKFTLDEYTEYKYGALFARIGYAYNSKYLVNLTGRRDGSSRFGPGKRFGKFGAVGAAWIFSEESVIKNSLAFMSLGKIRASYGITGNDQIGDYKFYNTYRINDLSFQGTITVSPEGLYNPEFAWETTRKFETAMELSFWDDRIFLQASWYRNRSSNQLVDTKLPTTTGFTSVLDNFDATVENSGLELVLSSVILNFNQFKWSSSVNISFPKNRLVKFPQLENSPYAEYYKVGESLSVQKLYTWKGVDASTGQYTFLDRNEDGDLSNEDKIFMKSRDRKYYGGIMNNFSYKGFELSFLFQFSTQEGNRYLYAIAGSRSNQLVEVMGRWQQEGDITDIQKFSSNSSLFNPFTNAQRSDHSIVSTSFVRLKTAVLSWSLPDKYISRAKIEHAKLYVQGQNLLTITDYVGLDPETGSYTLPPLKMITIGLQVKF